MNISAINQQFKKRGASLDLLLNTGVKVRQESNYAKSVLSFKIWFFVFKVHLLMLK